MKRLFVLVAACLLALSAVGQASAAKPVPVTFDSDSTFPLIDCSEFFPGMPEYDFVIYDHSVVHYEGIGIADDDGNPVSWRMHGTGTDSLFRDPNGLVLVSRFTYNTQVEVVSLDPFTYREKAVGTYWNVILPGTGKAFHEAGQFVQLLQIPPSGEGVIVLEQFKITGMHRFDVSPVCEAFAG